MTTNGGAARDTDAEVMRMDTPDGGHLTVEVEATARDHDDARDLVDDVLTKTVEAVRDTYDT